jgi:hypothetical protein
MRDNHFSIGVPAAPISEKALVILRLAAERSPKAGELPALIPLTRRRIFPTADIFPLKMVPFRRIEGYAEKIT